jgi:hypothetical protein
MSKLKTSQEQNSKDNELRDANSPQFNREDEQKKLSLGSLKYIKDIKADFGKLYREAIAYGTAYQAVMLELSIEQKNPNRVGYLSIEKTKELHLYCVQNSKNLEAMRAQLRNYWSEPEEVDKILHAGIEIGKANYLLAIEKQEEKRNRSGGKVGVGFFSLEREGKMRNSQKVGHEVAKKIFEKIEVFRRGYEGETLIVSSKN